MKENCEVIRDLLPLVQDGVASEASCRMVQEHLEECEACRTFCILPENFDSSDSG
mgnify:CR=1 FL=1